MNKDSDLYSDNKIDDNSKNKICKERKRKIRRITENISNCEIEDKTHVLNIIAAKLGTDCLHEEGTGTRILFDIIDNDLLDEIDKFVNLAIVKTKLNLDSDHDSS